MIQVNELRIGNCILYNGNQSCVQLITPLGIQLMERNSEYPKRETLVDGTMVINVGKLFKDFNELEPIQLTEQILFKCGFKKQILFPSTFLLEIETYSLSPVIKIYAYIDNTEAVSSVRLIQGSNRKGNMIQVKSLHQLQNLYFVLTGKELEVQL